MNKILRILHKDGALQKIEIVKKLKLSLYDFEEVAAPLIQQKLILEVALDLFAITSKGIEEIKFIDDEKLKSKIEIKKEDDEIFDENRMLRVKVMVLEKEVKSLTNEIQKLKNENEKLHQKIKGGTNKITYSTPSGSYPKTRSPLRTKAIPIANYDEQGNEFIEYAYSEEALDNWNRIWRMEEEERKAKEEREKILKDDFF